MRDRMRRLQKAWLGFGALMLALMAGAFLLAPSVALASESSELSDDGQDYGHFFRKGDRLYDIQNPNGEPVLYYVDGKWYGDERESASTGGVGLSEFYYVDGTLCIQYGAQICLDAINRLDELKIGGTGADWWLYDAQLFIQPGAAIGYRDSYPRLTFLKMGYDMRFTKDDLRRIIFDPDIVEDLGNYDRPGRYLVNLDRWFEGCTNLEEIQGLEHVPTAKVQNMARMFADCPLLEEIDLSGFDTSSCTDLGEMFDGCSSLTTLTFGDGWTQEAARVALESGEDGQPETELRWKVTSVIEGVLSIDPFFDLEPPSGGAHTAGRLATFPVAMTCERDGEMVRYAAGDVIPDGAATYTVADRTLIRETTATLMGPDGSTWTQGVDPSHLVCSYTGEEVRPSVSLSYGGVTLQEGSDYTVSYRNNTESGTAEVVLMGLGDYYGREVIPFAVKDDAAYAFLYEDGLLYIKTDHKAPSTAIVSSEKKLAKLMRWFDPSTPDAGTAVPWGDARDSIKRVMFDRSFASQRPVSAEGWFAGCTQLSSVEGLSRINGSSLESMAALFDGCSSLEEVDLTGLDTSHVRDVRALCRGCKKLAHLTLGKADLSQVTSSDGYVADCPLLAEIVTVDGWRNAADESAQLRLPSMAFKTQPSFARLQAGSALTAAAATYRLRELAMQMCNVEMATDTFTCTGAAIKPAMKVTLGNIELVGGTDYTISFAKNVYPGKAKATVMGKGVFSGGLVVPFTIKPGVTKVGDRLIVKNKSGTYTLKVTKVSKNGLAAEATILKVQATSGSTLTLPSECTVGGVKISVTAISSKLSGNFRNVKTVVVGAKVTTIGASAFSKAKKVTKLVLKTKKLKKVTNCLKGSRVSTVQTKVTLSSKKKKKYKKWFTSSSTVGRSVTYSYG